MVQCFVDIFVLRPQEKARPQGAFQLVFFQGVRGIFARAAVALLVPGFQAALADHHVDS